MSENSAESRNSYRSILKGASLMGGTQIFQVLINLVRTKFVALILGPSGMGVASMFTSSSETLAMISKLGLDQAMVKEVAKHQEDPESMRTVARVSLTLIRIAGLCGLLFCALAAPWLSQITFGNEDYVWQFVLLSLSIYLTVTGGGYVSLLQGMRRLKAMSRVRVIGSVVALAACVPFYYFFGTRGIVPAMVIMSLAVYLYARFEVSRNLRGERVRISWREHNPIVRQMVVLGLLLMSSGMIMTLCGYVLNIIIRVTGGLTDVGLFNAANSLTLQYSGVVFSALALDYFPRLSALASDNCVMRDAVNRQTEVTCYLFTPMALGVLVLAPIVVQLLLTDSFMTIIPLVRWMVLGVLLKAVSFPMAYISFAKDNKRLFFWLEPIFGNALYITTAVAGYMMFGIMGIGYAMVIENLVVILVYYAVNSRVYGYRFSGKAMAAVAVTAGLGALAFLSTYIPDMVISYYAMAMCLVVSVAVSFLNLKKMFREDRKSKEDHQR